MKAVRTARARIVLACLAIAVGVAGCEGDKTILPLIPPITVIRLVPRNASMPVGDTIALVAQITGGSDRVPPKLDRCTSTVPSVAAAIKSATACNVVGLSAGGTEIIAMASTGQTDRATVIVVAR